MHCEIIDRYFNVFFVEIQLNKENLERDFWKPKYVYPKLYTGLPNGLNKWLKNPLILLMSAFFYKKSTFFFGKNSTFTQSKIMRAVFEIF